MTTRSSEPSVRLALDAMWAAWRARRLAEARRRAMVAPALQASVSVRGGGHQPLPCNPLFGKGRR